MPTIRGDLGKRIRFARELASLRVAELAALLEVEPNTVYRWEQGVRTPSLELLKRIADICSVSFGWLVSGEGEPRSEAA